MINWPDEDDDPIELVIEDDRWLDADLAALTHRAAGVVAEWLEIDDLRIVVMGCDDARIAALNAEFRGRAVPTNVLSWPTQDFAPRDPGATPEAPPSPELGDIAISYDTCLREAEAQSKPFPHHVVHLLVHAVLHLAGYDHINDADAHAMEHAEREILNMMDIPDPYSEYER